MTKDGLLSPSIGKKRGYTSLQSEVAEERADNKLYLCHAPKSGNDTEETSKNEPFLPHTTRNQEPTDH